MGGIRPDFSGLDGGGSISAAPSPAPVTDDFDFSGLDKPPVSGLAALFNPEPLAPAVQDATKQLANFRELSRKAHEQAIEAMNHRIESQFTLININNTLRRKGVKLDEYTSPGYESLKKSIDPLYEETGIFIPAPVSFALDEQGFATGLADQWNVLPERSAWEKTKIFLGHELPGLVKNTPAMLFNSLAAPGTTFRYWALLPAVEKSGMFANVQKGGALDRYFNKDLQGFRDLAPEERNAILDEAAITMASLAVEMGTAFFVKGALTNYGIGNRAVQTLETAALGDDPIARAQFLMEAANNNPVMMARIRPLLDNAAAHAHTMSEIAGGIAGGAAYPLLDKSDNENKFTHAVALGMLGGVIGGIVGRHTVKKGQHLSSLDRELANMAAHTSQMRNISIASQNSMASAYRTIKMLEDTKLGLEETLAEVGRSEGGLTIVPVANKNIAEQLVDKLNEPIYYKAEQEWIEKNKKVRNKHADTIIEGIPVDPDRVWEFDITKVRRITETEFEIWYADDKELFSLNDETGAEFIRRAVYDVWTQRQDPPHLQLHAKPTRNLAGVAASFYQAGELRSLLIRGKDMPEAAWIPTARLFKETGMVPNELVYAANSFNMALVDAPVPPGNAREAKRWRDNIKIGGKRDGGTEGYVLRDPVTGRIAMIPSYAVTRNAGVNLRTMLSGEETSNLFNDFIKETTLESRRLMNENTPWVEVANKEVYPKSKTHIINFLTGEIQGYVPRTKETAKRLIEAFEVQNAGNLLPAKGVDQIFSDVRRFRLESLYKGWTDAEYAAIANELVGSPQPGTLGFIAYMQKAINIHALDIEKIKGERGGTNIETVIAHEIFHPIAGHIARVYPDLAKVIYEAAVNGDPNFSSHTIAYAKELQSGRHDAHYRTIAKKWEEVITEEMGDRALRAGLIGGNKTTRMPIQELIDTYIDMKTGLPWNDPKRAAMSNALNHEIARMMYDSWVNDVDKQFIKKFGEEASERMMRDDISFVVDQAATRGFILQDLGAGRVGLRDIYTNNMREFASTQEIRDFISNVPVPASRPLDVVAEFDMVPEAARGLGVMPSAGVVGGENWHIGDGAQPFQYHKPGWFEKTMTFINGSTPRFTAIRDYMIALDNTFGLQLYEKVYRPTQDAAFKNNEARITWLKRLSEIESTILDLDGEQRKLISAYRESMTPDEVAKGYLARPLNRAELNYGSQISQLNVDIQKVFDYLRKVEQLKQEAGEIGRFDFSGDPKDLITNIVEKKKKDLMLKIEQLANDMMMDDNHKLVAALFNEIKGLNPDDVSLGAVVRYARSLGKDGNPEISRGEFAKKNKMTPAQLAVADQLDKLYADLADVFQIDDYRRISGYMNHYRLYNELPEETTAFLRRLQKGARKINEKEFISQLMRTGELGLFETDPIRAALSYINAGFSSKHLYPTLVAAREEVVTQLGNVKNRKGRFASEFLNRYLDELTGIPNMAVEQTQANFDAYLNSLGQSKEVNFRTGLVNMYLALSNTATMGFRPALALRDLASFYTAHGSRFGFDRTTRGLMLALKPGAVEHLRSKGVLATIDIVEFLSPAEYEASGLRNASQKLPEVLRKVAEWGMTASGQKKTFELNHAAAYLEVEDLLLGTTEAPGLLVRLQRGEISKVEAYRKAFINSYDIPVIKAFDKLVSENKIPEAAHFLAKATSEETGFMYNLANHPFGWETNIGRMLGQFGTWPVWMTRYLTRLASRGTRKELFGVYRRFAMSQAAIKGTEKVTGFNMYSWYLSPNFGYAGGPMLQLAMTTAQAIGTGNDRVKDQKMKEMMNMLPFVRYGEFDPSKPGSMFIPGSFAMQDWIAAFQLYEGGYNPVTALGKGFGFAVDKKRRSVLDNIFGARHPFKY